MNTKTNPLTNGHNSYQWEFQQTVGSPPSNNYIHIVYEEFQHLFNFNFGVLVREIRVMFNKVVFLLTDHQICIFPFPIFVKETAVNDVKKSKF
jgi:hypothetical protein